MSTSQILDILRQYNIRPLDDDFADIDLPDIGQIGENESVYSTSLKAVFGEGADQDDEGPSPDLPAIDEPRMWDWQEELGLLIGDNGQQLRAARRLRVPEAPESHCAWYCPVHFFGHGWGIHLLTTAPDGALVLVESNRGHTQAEAVAQALDYPSG